MQESLNPKERIIVALDVSEIDKALALVEQLKAHVGLFKIGLEFITSLITQIVTASTPADITQLTDKICRLFQAVSPQLFWDGKLKDIPNTVGGAAGNIARLGVAMCNVHCDGGVKMMKAAKLVTEKVAGEIGLAKPPLVLGVTVLTSLGYDDLATLGLMKRLNLANSEELANAQSERMQRLVVELALAAQDAGLDGVIASPKEIKAIRDRCQPEFLIVTPGIRPVGAKLDDQNRVGTPSQAIADGADFLVIGRPITEAVDPVKAACAIAEEITSVKV